MNYAFVSRTVLVIPGLVITTDCLISVFCNGAKLSSISHHQKDETSLIADEDFTRGSGNTLLVATFGCGCGI